MCNLCINAMLSLGDDQNQEAFRLAVERCFADAANTFRLEWMIEFTEALFAEYDDDVGPGSDARGFPQLVYERHFVHAVAGAAIAAGAVKDARTFFLYMSLSDRYVRRGEFLLSLVEDIFCPAYPEAPPSEEHVSRSFAKLVGLTKKQMLMLKEGGDQAEGSLLSAEDLAAAVIPSIKRPRVGKKRQKGAEPVQTQTSLF